MQWTTTVIGVGRGCAQSTEQVPQPRPTVKTLARKWSCRWASKGREELARQGNEEECILPGRESSMCKGPGVMLEPGRLRKGQKHSIRGNLHIGWVERGRRLPCRGVLITVSPLNLCSLTCQPSPIKKERSPRPQSFCHSSSISPQDKLSLPGYGTPRDKQRLSYSAFTNQIFASTSTDSPTSPTSEAPPLPPRNAGKGTGLDKGLVTPS